MLILLMNFSSVFHTVFHISIAHETFCIAQHDENAAPHLEARFSPLVRNTDCAVCQYQLRCDCTDLIYNEFSLSENKNTAKSLYLQVFISVNTVHSSSRAPPIA